MLFLANNSINSIARFISLLLIFLFVVLVCYFTTRYIANFQKSRDVGSNIHVIETSRIANNKFIQIVNIGNKYFCIAICKDTVTFIGELEADDIDINKFIDNNTLSFKELFDKAKCKLSRTCSINTSEGESVHNDDESE